MMVYALLVGFFSPFELLSSSSPVAEYSFCPGKSCRKEASLAPIGLIKTKGDTPHTHQTPTHTFTYSLSRHCVRSNPDFTSLSCHRSSETESATILTATQTLGFVSIHQIKPLPVPTLESVFFIYKIEEVRKIALPSMCRELVFVLIKSLP